ncbi:MAG: Dabb family protein [Thermoguttaceae bacterium]|nr:Dabb family protein [Thermoguttaceae bacterium]
MMIHTVFFTLKDKTPAVFNAFVEDTKTFGKDIPGTVFFQVGTRLPDQKDPIYDQDFDVMLVSTFPDAKTLDAYLVHPDHVAYCERNGNNWANIRIADAQG